MIQTVIQNMLLFYFFVTYIGISACLFITEDLLLKKNRKRIVMLFLLISGMFSLIWFCVYPVKQVTCSYDLVKIEVKMNETAVGTQLAVIERETDSSEKTLQYLGEFITDEGSESQYFNVKIENGKVCCEDFPAYEDAIQEAFSEHKISITNFQGHSLTYQDLMKKVDAMRLNEKATFKSTAIKFAVAFLPVTILVMEYIIFEIRRKKKNMMIKMKLADL